MGSKIQNVIVETDNDAIFSIRCCFNFSLNYKPEEPVLNSIEKNTLLIILIMSTEAWTYINVLELIKLILIKYCWSLIDLSPTLQVLFLSLFCPLQWTFNLLVVRPVLYFFCERSQSFASFICRSLCSWLRSRMTLKIHLYILKRLSLTLSLTLRP